MQVVDTVVPDSFLFRLKVSNALALPLRHGAVPGHRSPGAGLRQRCCEETSKLLRDEQLLEPRLENEALSQARLC
jgi:hypothetical protein